MQQQEFGVLKRSFSFVRRNLFRRIKTGKLLLAGRKAEALLPHSKDASRHRSPGL
jgi:hypothetical protein